ncbi:MAG: PEP-CTERM sorting domain-containing protein [Azonexus sp.]|nr:PEP-CTERM sorting domain-containing protein [Azonexus sp.]
MPKLLRITTLVSMLFAALPAAQAATQSYSFLGTLNAIQFSGSFSFDDSLLTVFDFVNNPLLTVAPVASLSMTYNDVSYSHLDAWGPPDVSYHNGAFLGLSYSNDAMTFVPGLLNTSDAYVTDGQNSADVIYAAVPEPESYAMFLAGLGLMGLAALRRSRQA